MKLEGRVAVVTGAAQGIGRGIAEKLRAEGADVAVVDINGEGAASVASQLDGLAIRADISSEDDANRMAKETLDRYSKIDILVNAAAIVPFIPWDEVDFAYWRKLMSVDLDGAYLVSRAVERPMREAGYGRIVQIASNAFMAGTPNMGPYLAAKGGVVGLTRALATELGKYGITANAVAPGITRTEGYAYLAAQGRVRLRPDAAGDSPPRGAGRHRSSCRIPSLRGVGVGNRPSAGRRRRPYPQLMAVAFAVTRAGAILAVSDIERSMAFYRDQLGFEVESVYDDPPYATLVQAGSRLSLAEQGHPAEDRPGVTMVVPEDRSRLPAILVVEVEDCLGAYRSLRAAGVEFLAEPYSPPWGGHRCFAVDPDGFLIELEEPA